MKECQSIRDNRLNVSYELKTIDEFIQTGHVEYEAVELRDNGHWMGFREW